MMNGLMSLGSRENIETRYLIIKKCMQMNVKECFKNENNLDKAEIMCLLYLKEIKQSLDKNIHKHEIYIFLLTIKIVRNNNLKEIED